MPSRDIQLDLTDADVAAIETFLGDRSLTDSTVELKVQYGWLTDGGPAIDDVILLRDDYEFSLADTSLESIWTECYRRIICA